MKHVWIVLLLLGGFAKPTLSATNNTTEQATQPAQPVTRANRPLPDLVTAYQQEFAFLESQKRQLEQELADFTVQARQREKQAQRQLDALDREVRSGEQQLETLQQQAHLLQQKKQSQQERAEAYQATLEQAQATLREMGASIKAVTSQEMPVQPLLAQAERLLQQQAEVRLAPGSFFLADGRSVHGHIAYIGNIARLGMSEQGAGALAPAGDGNMKVWPQSAEQTVREWMTSVIRGEQPASSTLPLYLFESSRLAVEENLEKSIDEVINSGGVIAWLIVGLGGVAVLLVLLRAFFLGRASASIGKTADRIGKLVRAGQIDQAMQQCSSASAICRVIRTTLRNLDREREHLEDIISEAILHESVYLNRFGSAILVVAAVSPLLGLLGTVTGMISTFDIITEFGTGDPKLLSSGISVALVTTEIGLVVAIPSLIAGNLLSGWAENIKTDTERAALRVMNQYQDYLLENQPGPELPPQGRLDRKAA